MLDWAVGRAGLGCSRWWRGFRGALKRGGPPSAPGEPSVHVVELARLVAAAPVQLESEDGQPQDHGRDHSDARGARGGGGVRCDRPQSHPLRPPPPPAPPAARPPSLASGMPPPPPHVVSDSCLQLLLVAGAAAGLLAPRSDARRTAPPATVSAWTPSTPLTAVAQHRRTHAAARQVTAVHARRSTVSMPTTEPMVPWKPQGMESHQFVPISQRL